ncbi:NnrU family protein [Fulvimarina endophytica]|uniref:NnrU family protein n=1 Tax=Fulvimarina endophytica TaxID=2293836 RepID=UPI001FE17A9B|nr:NnrU family protein [Fulvimarina endophytica]
MSLLIVGLILFIGMHSIRVVGEAPRNLLISRIGEMPYRASYSLLSLIGLVLIGQGYGEALASHGRLYTPPPVLSLGTLALVPVAFVLVSAAYLPASHIKRAARHPMVLGVGLWAAGHLLANGETANVVLFGAFFVWAVLDYLSSLRRNAQPVGGKVASAKMDLLSLVIGLSIAAVFIVWAHEWLFGVSPLARN